MSQLATPVSTGEVAIFKPRLYYQVLGVAFGIVIALIVPGLFLIFAIGIRGDFSPSSWGAGYWITLVGVAIAALVFLALGFYTYTSNAGQLLAVGPGGMVYKSGSRSALRVRWDDIESYGSASQSTASFSGFFVNASLVKESKALETLAALKPFLLVLGYIGMLFGGAAVNPASGISTDLSYRSQIPMTLFDKNWEQSKIGTLIARYCPRLFEPKQNQHDLNIIRIDTIPAPTVPQPANLQPPDVRSVKNNRAGLVLGVFSILTVVVLVGGFVILNNRGGGPLTPPAQTYDGPGASSDTAPSKFGPISGQMSTERANGNSNPTSLSISNINALTAQALFTNPNDPKDGKWDYGFSLSISTDQSYRFLVNSSGNYQIADVKGSGSSQKQTILKNGNSSKIETKFGKMNTVKLVDTKNTYSFFVNNNLLDTVSLNLPTPDFQLELAYNPDDSPGSSQFVLVFNNYHVEATSNSK